MSAPVDYTNDVRTIAALDNFMSINNAVDLDLFGQVNAESAGIKHISGAGGQLDFVLGAYLFQRWKELHLLLFHFQEEGRYLRVQNRSDTGSRLHRNRYPCEYPLARY